jgi:hypothetical protein
MQQLRCDLHDPLDATAAIRVPPGRVSTEVLKCSADLIRRAPLKEELVG